MANTMVEEQLGATPVIGRLCSKCSHVNVCSVYRAVAGLMNGFEASKPFGALELAVICKEFSPVCVKAFSEFKSFTKALK